MKPLDRLVVVVVSIVVVLVVEVVVVEVVVVVVLVVVVVVVVVRFGSKNHESSGLRSQDTPTFAKSRKSDLL